MRERVTTLPISRRRFLGASALAGAAAGASLAGCAAASTGLKRADLGDGTGPTVAIQRIPEYANALEIETAAREAIEELGGLAWLGRGDKVLIKPASNSANRYPAVTRPELVTAVARILRKEGAGRVVVADHPGVQTVHHTRDDRKGSTRETMRRNGLLAGIEVGGAEFLGFEEPGYEAFFPTEPRGGACWRGPLMLPAIVGEVDHIVYLNRVSTHALAGATLSLKNAVGWIREDSRLELHRDADTFLEKCAEINAAPEIADRVRLVMSEATEVQTTIGPDFGYSVRLETPVLVASANLAMHDVAAYGLLQYARARTPWIARATDPYPGNASWMNRIFVGMTWGFGQAMDYRAYSAPAHGRAADNRVIRRGIELLSPGAPRPRIAWMAELPESLRTAVVEA